MAAVTADSVYAYQAAQGTYVEGTILDALWPAATLLVGYAAWEPAGRAIETARARHAELAAVHRHAIDVLDEPDDGPAVVGQYVVFKQHIGNAGRDVRRGVGQDVLAENHIGIRRIRIIRLEPVDATERPNADRLVSIAGTAPGTDQPEEFGVPDELYFEYREKNVERWRELYRTLMAEGRVREMPVERITDVILAVLYGAMFINYFGGRSGSFSASAEDILDVVFFGILGEPERSRRRPNTAGETGPRHGGSLGNGSN